MQNKTCKYVLVIYITFTKGKKSIFRQHQAQYEHKPTKLNPLRLFRKNAHNFEAQVI